jgi:hypothetical protein
MKNQYSIFRLSLLFLVLLLSQNVSSQCEFGFETSNSDITAEANPSEATLYGQGFTAECSGLLEYVQFISSGEGTFKSGTIKVFSGNGTEGIPIYSEVYPDLSIPDGRRPIRVEITEPLEVTKDSQYTFQLVVNNEVGIVFSGENQYAGGSAFDGETAFENLDFFFDVSIAAQSLSVDNNEIPLKLTLSPNPSKDFVQIANLKNSKKYEIFNVLGRQVQKGIISNNKKIDIRNFSSGLYLLKVEGGAFFKFIKK